MEEKILEKIKEKVKKLPEDPGVYLMKNSHKEIIYVGKAKNLKNRVSSYFRAIDSHLPKVYKMVMNVVDFDYIVTNSEFEALILECSLIKQHNPKYNILLKDDKGFSYLRITTGEEYPRISESKNKTEDGSLYMGPYNSSYIVKQTVDNVNKVFLLPTCSKKFPQEIGKGRPCLNYHIKQCMGVCGGGISKKQYGAIIKEAIEYIKHGTTASLKDLNNQMEQAAENMEFEKAALLRDRIRALEKMGERQLVVEAGSESLDVLAFVKTSDNCCCTLLKYRDNRLVDKEDYLLGEADNLQEVRREFIRSYYVKNKEIPTEIALDGDCEDMELMSQYLSHLLGKKVVIFLPQKGNKLKLVEMARNNASQKLSQLKDYSAKDVEALDRLGRVLGLKKPPMYIEAYDISNFGDSVIVGGMVVFQEGKPYRKAYRKFNIKTLVTRDDYHAMAEMLQRRFNRYKEDHSGEGFGKLPDLILLDGGVGHLNTIAKLLTDMGIDVPVFGMVKDNKHRTRAITSEGGEISLSAHKGTYRFIAAIQEEVHRYSIAHSRKKHSKEGLTSALTQVEGIGEKRAMDILKHFKTQKALKEATLEQIKEVKGISAQTAERLYNHLAES